MSDERWAALPPAQLQGELTAHLEHLAGASARNIGFPAATDLDVGAMAPFLQFMINNLNDPQQDGQYPIHTKRFETEACDMVADLLCVPAGDRWGYVTSGATEGTEHALHLAREMYPTGLVYVSAAAHPTIATIIRRLRMDSVTVRTVESGEIDYPDLAAEVWQRRDRPAIVVACVGTPLTEAIDDVARIDSVLDDLAVHRRWIHADAALSGIPLALLDDKQRPGFDFTAGTRSIVVSGHKFPGTPVPCAIFLMRDSDRAYPGRAATYTGSRDSTWSNSRSGFAALCLWHTLRRHGTRGLRVRAEQARDLAGYTHRRLTEIGWPAWRHNPHGFTVVLKAPPIAVTDRWPLPRHGTVSHIVSMPGLTHARLDLFLTDLQRAINPVAAGEVAAALNNHRRPVTVQAPRSRPSRSPQPT